MQLDTSGFSTGRSRAEEALGVGRVCVCEPLIAKSHFSASFKKADGDGS